MPDQLIHAIDDEIDRARVSGDHQVPRHNGTGTLHAVPEIGPEEDGREIQHLCAAELGNGTGIQFHAVEICHDQVTRHEQFVVIVADGCGIGLRRLKILWQHDLIASGGKLFDLFCKQHVACQFLVVEKTTGEINLFCHAFTCGSLARLFAISSSVGM